MLLRLALAEVGAAPTDADDGGAEAALMPLVVGAACAGAAAAAAAARARAPRSVVEVATDGGARGRRVRL